MQEFISNRDNASRRTRIDQLTKADRILLADRLQALVEYVYDRTIVGRFEGSPVFAAEGVVSQADKSSWQEAPASDRQA